jgi:hypothetical protein
MLPTRKGGTDFISHLLSPMCQNACWPSSAHDSFPVLMSQINELAAFGRLRAIISSSFTALVMRGHDLDFS